MGYMKNVEIKKMLQGATKYADEYKIKVWAWQDGEATWAEVIALVDGAVPVSVIVPDIRLTTVLLSIISILSTSFVNRLIISPFASPSKTRTGRS